MLQPMMIPLAYAAIFAGLYGFYRFFLRGGQAPARAFARAAGSVGGGVFIIAALWTGHLKLVMFGSLFFVMMRHKMNELAQRRKKPPHLK